MANDNRLWWMGKMAVVLIFFSSCFLYADGDRVFKNKNINKADSNSSFWPENGDCKRGMLYNLGDYTQENFCYIWCYSSIKCDKDQKCLQEKGFSSNFCAPKCDVDDDCEYPTKCNMTDKYCFWEKCKSDDDCQNSLTCSLSTISIDKFCSRGNCWPGNASRCEDYQTCNLKRLACQCPNGTSGRHCEVLEWCKDNGKFKDCKGVNGTCQYIKSERELKCICTNGKKLHPEENRCRETCANKADCKNGGTCEEKGGYKFCSCKLGFIGDKCETVFDCSPEGKYKNCESSGGKCFYNGNKAICECPGNKKFNDKQFICETCTCRGGECIIEGEKFVCKCPPGYGNFTNNSCKVCDCGPDINCIWEARFGGSKVCLCKPGYSTKNGKCVACECGPDSNCEWLKEGWLKPERKICHCKPGYRDENGKCIDIKTISSRGTTDSATISTILSSIEQDIGTTSLRGTTESSTISTFLSSTDQDCHCGSYSYSCSLDSAGNKVCGCFKAYSQLDGSCTECNCGPFGTCSFEHGQKKCICKSFATERNGVCVDKQDLRKVFQVSFTYNIFL